ncbi:virion-associated protein [Acrasis kona]|uniref:Virion-associated protein n=1 Tax=Acrasis kona TaxID=1008807 RepID=A0AAW2YYJ5_9EUKA
MVIITNDKQVLGAEANPRVPIDKLLQDSDIKFVDKKYESDGLFTYYFKNENSGEELVYNRVNPDSHSVLKGL